MASMSSWRLRASPIRCVFDFSVKRLQFSERRPNARLRGSVPELLPADDVHKVTDASYSPETCAFGPYSRSRAVQMTKSGNQELPTIPEDACRRALAVSSSKKLTQLKLRGIVILSNWRQLEKRFSRAKRARNERSDTLAFLPLSLLISAKRQQARLVEYATLLF